MSGPDSLLLCLGGGLGALGRYLVGLGMPGPARRATLLVNVLGSALMGGALVLFADRSGQGGLIVIGFCGGFTTFSGFAVDTLMANRIASQGRAVSNVAVNLAGSLLACAAGMALAQSL